MLKIAVAAAVGRASAQKWTTESATN